MMPIKEIIRYVEESLRLAIDGATNPIFIVITGSHAYPEFARDNSDLDLIVVHTNGDSSVKPFTKLELVETGEDIDLLIEMRAFSLNQIEDYAITCDLAKQFAFIRGYRVILDKCPAALEAVHLCENRYWTDSYTTYKLFCELDIAAKLESLRYHLTDSRNYVFDERIQRQKTLMSLRIAEILKDFIGQMWALDCIEKAKSTNIDSLDKNHPLLAHIGLLRVFVEPRGGRMIDWKKYSVSLFVKDMIEALDLSAHSSLDLLFEQMDSLFRKRFGKNLFITDMRSSQPVLWRQ